MTRQKRRTEIVQSALLIAFFLAIGILSGGTYPY